MRVRLESGRSRLRNDRLQLRSPLPRQTRVEDWALKEMLTVREVSEFVGISPRTVYNYVKRGRLPSMKLGGSRRILKEDAEKLRDELENAGGTDDSIPEGATSLKETAAWLKNHPNHVRRMALQGQIRYGKTPISGRLYFYPDQVLEDLKN